MEEVFSNIYKNNKWGSSESVSGPGSSKLSAKVVVNDLPKILHKYNVNSFFDAPCGDMNWMQQIAGSIKNYIGGDIVEEIININKVKFPNLKFLKIDITKDALPDVDMIFVRDCLIHFSRQSFYHFIGNLSQSKIKYIATTNFTKNKVKQHHLKYINQDIEDGGFNILCLQAKPYNISSPIDVVDEAYSGKHMGIWETSNFVEELNLSRDIYRTCP